MCIRDSRLPPKAGLVIRRSFDSSSIARAVQSAVSPVSSLDATLGPKSLPINVAPMNNISGFCAYIASTITFAYPSVE